MARTVHIIPHTHWDREWYRTFQSFRMELVDLVDETLSLLESNPAYAHFMLDGQMAVIDDYLEIRPSNLARLGRLCEAGRLVTGPWYILMDEFGVSGESIIRNLEMGLDRSEDFGGAMPVGYLPDMFGHIAQMPQILRQFGFEDTVVWRGVPEANTQRPAFTWSAPDGSSIRAQYLPWGYGNGVGLPPDPESLVRRVELFCQRAGSAAGGDGEPVLWMHGTDHRHPIRELPEMVARANALQDDWHFVLSTLPRYIAEQRLGGEPEHGWQGELRSGARANLLMGVTSNRVDVKTAVARCERSIEQLAEPLVALFQTPEDWPATFFHQAWRLMVLNSAHDSICACSHDDVVLSVLDRYAQANAIADGLIERAKIAAYRHASPSIAASPIGSAVIVNTSARKRSGLVELQVPAGETPQGTQELWEMPARLPFVTRIGADALTWMTVVNDQLGDVHDIAITPGDAAIEVDLFVDPRRFGLLDPTESTLELERLTSEQPEIPVRFFYVGQPEHHVLAYVEDVPGFGWKIAEPGAINVDAVEIHEDGRGLKNAHLDIRVAQDGSFSMNGHDGLGLIVDDGDRGDTYNYCPVGDGATIEGLDKVTVQVTERGHLRSRLVVSGTTTWPEQAFGDVRIGEVTCRVDVELELRADEDFVRVEVRLDNRARDHRIRAHFALPDPTDHSRAECAFATVERGLDAQGGPSEPAMTTRPSRRFVQAGGITVVHEGLNEYELVDIDDAEQPKAHALAVTLLRATGMLSAAPMPSRPLPAGPMDRVEGAQMQGRQVFRYALHVGQRNPYELVDDAFVPLLVAGSKLGDSTDAATSDVEVPEAESMLEVTGAQVSSLRRLAEHPEVLELRVFNPTDEPTTLRVPRRTGTLVDLLGEQEQPFDGSCELAPWAIQTIRLDP